MSDVTEVLNNENIEQVARRCLLGGHTGSLVKVKVIAADALAKATELAVPSTKSRGYKQVRYQDQSPWFQYRYQERQTSG